MKLAEAIFLLCRCEEYSDEAISWSQWDRHVEFTLSRARFFDPLRMTQSEGLRMMGSEGLAIADE